MSHPSIQPRSTTNPTIQPPADESAKQVTETSPSRPRETEATASRTDLSHHPFARGAAAQQQPVAMARCARVVVLLPVVQTSTVSVKRSAKEHLSYQPTLSQPPWMTFEQIPRCSSNEAPTQNRNSKSPQRANELEGNLSQGVKQLPWSATSNHAFKIPERKELPSSLVFFPHIPAISTYTFQIFVSL